MSALTCLATLLSCLPGSRAQASQASHLTRFLPRASGATSRVCRRTPGSSWGRWTSLMSTSSRGCRQLSRSIRSRRLGIRVQRLAQSPRSTTICDCCSRGSASLIARFVASRLPGKLRSRLWIKCSNYRRARASRFWRRWFAHGKVSTLTSFVRCRPRGSHGRGLTGSCTVWLSRQS